jgi:hypothetical protein
MYYLATARDRRPTGCGCHILGVVPATDWILHVDLDEFIAAVEMARRPELRGLPVVVGGEGDPTKRTVVATASYAAREFGIRSGMPLRTAAKRCPEAVFLPSDLPAYEEVSEQVMIILRRFPVVVEILGWDEAFLGARIDDPEALAADIRRAVLAGTGLSCSVGIPTQTAGQTGDGLREACRNLPIDQGKLGGGDGRAAHGLAVGNRRQDVEEARRVRHHYGG